MKKIIYLLLVVAILGTTIAANAALVDNRNGTITDTDTNLMWLMDANYACTSDAYESFPGNCGQMFWYMANSWTENLVYGGYSDWRLPTANTINEMDHLFYTELGNVEDQYYLTGTINTGPFINLTPNLYWTGTTNTYLTYDNNGYPNGTATSATTFNFANGLSRDYIIESNGTPSQGVAFAIAVRDAGTTPVAPEPISSLLFITGGTLLAGMRFIRRKA